MLKELMENIPIEVTMSIQDFQNKLFEDFIVTVYEVCRIDINSRPGLLNSEEIEKVIDCTKHICQKISASSVITTEQKTFIINFVMNVLFELWRISNMPELFFIKIKQKFTPAQIVSSLAVYVGDWQKHQWVVNFFATHKQIFVKRNNKIRTIALYYTRIFNGGIERFLSLIIPVYIKLGYRVILFTDISSPEMEYSLPPPIPCLSA